MTLYIPVHKVVRELDGKLLFAMKAARRGFSSIIGRSSKVRRYLKFGSPGIFFDFRMNQSRATVEGVRHETFRQMGHEIWLFDEEVTTLDDPIAYSRTQISKQVVEEASKILACSDFHADLVRGVSDRPPCMSPATPDMTYTTLD
jgi:hypothetical protein